MKKEFARRVFVGLLGGIVISYLITIGISIAIGDGSYYPCVPSLIERFGNELTAIIMQTALSAVLGAGFAGSSIIWEMDEWSLLKQTSIYFGIVSVLMMTIAYICEWMEHSVKGILSYFGIFVAIFIAVWIVQYLIWKVRVSRIKEKIQKNN
ncbi:MAG: DUF3021 domain-containing protein [Oscillospiraceae bacterium]|nr:DUF3021 domain-containing protein [Oscillospiraceae bacterium]